MAWGAILGGLAAIALSVSWGVSSVTQLERDKIAANENWNQPPADPLSQLFSMFTGGSNGGGFTSFLPIILMFMMMRKSGGSSGSSDDDVTIIITDEDDDVEVR